MEDTNLYDEFGNYIGSDLSSSSDDESDHGNDNGGQIGEGQEDPVLGQDNKVNGFENDITDSAASTDIVLHEDKTYFASANDIYGDGVEAITMEEDTQNIAEPLVKPIKTRSISVLESRVPETVYDNEYLAGFMTSRSLVRNVAFVGHIHSGKTTLMDMLIESTHKESWESSKWDKRYTDSRKDEQSRGMSIKSCPVTLLLPNLRKKHYLFNLIDCPGHVAFSAERTRQCAWQMGLCWLLMLLTVCSWKPEGNTRSC